MPRTLRIRFAAGAVTAVICWLWRDSGSTFLWLTYSLGFAHYALALWYSTRQIRAATQTAPQSLSLAGLGLFSLFLYQVDFPLIAYFGLHHALNEAYASRRSPDLPVEAPRLMAAATAFQAVAYFTTLRFSPELAGIKPLWIWCTFAVAGLWFATELHRLRHSPTRDLYASAVMASILVVISLFVRLTFIQVVLYHFILWALLPLERIAARGQAALARYVALSSVVTASFLLASPLGASSMRISMTTFSEQFLFWSYAHITLSFALSDAHPTWIVRLFRGDPMRRLAIPPLAG